jgi:hypothetical protein
MHRNRSCRTTALFFSALLLALAGVISGCPSRVDDADLRVLHLSPDAPAVDVWARAPESRLFQNLEFTEGTTYRTLDEGTYTLEVVPAGGAIDDTVLTLEGIQLEEDVTYTAVVIGRLDALQGLILIDDVRAVGQGEIRIRAIHAAPDVGEVDVWNITDPEAPAPLVENVSFGQASGNLNIPAGAYVLGIDATGNEQPDIVFELPELQSGLVANVYVTQDDDGTPFVLLQQPDGTTVRVDARPTLPELEEDQAGVRFVHLSPDAPAVDVWTDTEGPSAESLAFGETTDYIGFPVGIEFISVVPGGADREDAVLTVESPGLEVGQLYTVVVFNDLDAIEALLLLDDLEGTEPGNIRVRPVHVAVGVDIVDIWVARQNEAPVLAFEDVAFGEAADALEVPAGNYQVGLDVGRDGLIDATAPLGGVTAATIANVYAVTNADGDILILVQENGRITPIEAMIEDPPLSPDQAFPAQ